MNPIQIEGINPYATFAWMPDKAGATATLNVTGDAPIKTAFIGSNGQEVTALRDKTTFTVPAGGGLLLLWNGGPSAPRSQMGLTWQNGGFKWEPQTYAKALSYAG